MIKKRQRPAQSEGSKTRKPHKKLKITIAALAIIVIFSGIWVGVFFATKNIIAATAPATVDELCEKVQNYDYKNGHSEEIESDIKRLLTETLNEETRDNYTKTLKAKAEYYYGLQKYNTAVTVLKELEDYIVNADDAKYVYQSLAKAYDKFGNSDKSKEYQNKYDNLTRKCGSDSNSDENSAN